MSPDRDAEKPPVECAGAVVRDGSGRFLLVRRARPPALGRWSLPGGRIEPGETPAEAAVREVREETGLEVTVGDRAWIDSVHRTPGHRTPGQGSQREDFHAVRIVYDGAVAPDSPDPRVVEQDGSTVDARWVPLADVLSGGFPVVAMVHDALAAMRPVQRQRISAYALVTRDDSRGDSLLLTRISTRGHHPGAWTLPGGGVDHGEAPAAALAREVAEETGLEVSVGGLLGVHDVHFTGVAPSGLTEDFHGVHLVFRAEVGDGEPRVVEADGTTDGVAWVRRSDVEEGRVEVLDVVRYALDRVDSAAGGRTD
jgi:ADP-ribose pyrophosphatase YjhB (NUDIX family)